MALDPYTGVLAWNNAEGGTDGATVSASSSGGGSGTAFTNTQLTGTGSLIYDSTNAIHDTLSYFVNPIGGYANLTWNSTVLGTALTTACGVMYVKMVAYPATGNSALVTAQQLDSGTIAYRVRVTSIGTLVLTSASEGSVGTMSAVMALGTTYRIEWQINHSASTWTLELFEGESTTALETLSGTEVAGKFGPQTQTVRFGRLNSTDYTARFDTMAMNGTKLGPRARVNIVPTSNAGVARNDGKVGTPITVTGSDADSDGTIVTREWTCTARPAGAVAPTLTNAATNAVTFTPTAQGVYTLSYRVRDNDDAWSTPSTMNVNVAGTLIFAIGLTNNAGGWTNNGGAASLVAAVSDGLDVTYVESRAALTNPSKIRYRLAPLVTPSSGGFALNIRGNLSAAAAVTGKVRLYEGAILRKEWTYSPTTTLATTTFTMTDAEIATVGSWMALDLELYSEV